MSILLLFFATKTLFGIEKRYVHAASGIQLFEAASIDSKALALIPFNVELDIVNCGESVAIDPLEIPGEWCQTAYDGKTGWVYSTALGKKKSPYDLQKYLSNPKKSGELWRNFLSDCESGKYKITKMLGKVDSLEMSRANRIPCYTRAKKGKLIVGCGEDQKEAEIRFAGDKLMIRNVHSNLYNPDNTTIIFNCRTDVFSVIEGTTLGKDSIRISCIDSEKSIEEFPIPNKGDLVKVELAFALRAEPNEKSRGAPVKHPGLKSGQRAKVIDVTDVATRYSKRKGVWIRIRTDEKVPREGFVPSSHVIVE